MPILESNNCYMPMSKPESEMTDEERETMRKFEAMKQLYRLSDRLRWHTELVKMQIRVYDDFIKK